MSENTPRSIELEDELRQLEERLAVLKEKPDTKQLVQVATELQEVAEISIGELADLENDYRN